MTKYKYNKAQRLAMNLLYYTLNHPAQRFWQALRNWATVNKIYVDVFNKEIEDTETLDTFYFEDKNK